MNHSSNKYLLNTYHVQYPVLVFVEDTKTWIEQTGKVSQSHRMVETRRGAGASESSKDREMDEEEMRLLRGKVFLRGHRKAWWNQGQKVNSNGITIQSICTSQASKEENSTPFRSHEPLKGSGNSLSLLFSCYRQEMTSIKPPLQALGHQDASRRCGGVQVLSHALCVYKCFPGICHASNMIKIAFRVTHSCDYHHFSTMFLQGQALNPERTCSLTPKSPPLTNLHPSSSVKHFAMYYFFLLVSRNLPSETGNRDDVEQDSFEHTQFL